MRASVLCQSGPPSSASTWASLCLLSPPVQCSRFFFDILVVAFQAWRLYARILTFNNHLVAHLLCCTCTQEQKHTRCRCLLPHARRLVIVQPSHTGRPAHARARSNVSRRRCLRRSSALPSPLNTDGQCLFFSQQYSSRSWCLQIYKHTDSHTDAQAHSRFQ